MTLPGGDGRPAWLREDEGPELPDLDAPRVPLEVESTTEVLVTRTAQLFGLLGGLPVAMVVLLYLSGDGLYATAGGIGLGLLGLCGLAVLVRRTVEGYYVLDNGAGTLEYHWALLGLRGSRVALRLEDVVAVGVDGHYLVDSHGMGAMATAEKVWTYTPVLLDRRGGLTHLGAFRDEEAADAYARGLAEHLGVEHVPATRERGVRVEWDGKNPRLVATETFTLLG